MYMNLDLDVDTYTCVSHCIEVAARKLIDRREYGAPQIVARKIKRLLSSITTTY